MYLDSKELLLQVTNRPLKNRIENAHDGFNNDAELGNEGRKRQQETELLATI